MSLERTSRVMHCADCGGERLFEQPPCADGHGEMCPELACVGCGSAMLVGDPLLDPEIPAVGARSVA